MSAEDAFVSFPVLRTRRLCLRQMTPRDAVDLYAFYSDPAVTRHLDWNGPASPAASRELILSWNESYRAKKLIPWVIFPRESGHLIGTLMLMPTRGTFEEMPLFPLSVGFDLDRSYWNKGYMSEALQAALAFGKETISPHRIQAEVVPDNAASLKVLKRLGFQEEGCLKRYLLHEVTRKFMDVIVLALILS